MNEMSDPHKHIRPCPICRKPAVDRYSPFCSKRCGDVDLGRWLHGHYVVQSNESPAGEDDENQR